MGENYSEPPQVQPKIPSLTPFVTMSNAFFSSYRLLRDISPPSLTKHHCSTDSDARSNLGSPPDSNELLSPKISSHKLANSQPIKVSVGLIKILHKRL